VKVPAGCLPYSYIEFPIVQQEIRLQEITQAAGYGTVWITQSITSQQ